MSRVLLTFGFMCPMLLLGQAAFDEPAGACCLANGNCLELGEVDCDFIDGGVWHEGECADLDGDGMADACELNGPKLYWTEYASEPVHRANLDGSGEERLLETGDSYKEAVHVDTLRNRVYWMGSEFPHSANVNGGDLKIIPVEFTRYWDVTGLLLDVATGKLYWGQFGGGGIGHGIWRADLDGSNAELIIPTDGSPTSIAIARPTDACDYLAADSNQDGRIDLRDYARFQACFSGP